MTTDTELPTPGRPVRLVPTAPGLWMTILGTCLAGLAPLFGFLIGTIVVSDDADAMFQPIYWGMFVGVVIGGIGVGLAVLGGVRLWRQARKAPVAGAEA